MWIKNIKNWKKNVLDKNNTIRDAIKIINETGVQIIVILDSKKNVVGTVTDGDIRRVLNKRNFLDKKLFEVSNKQSTCANFNYSNYKIEELFTKSGVNYVPIIKNKKLVGIKKNFLKKIKYKKNLYIIPAGGYGKRLLPLTKKTPKPMLKLNNMPILEHVILNAKKNGFVNFIIITHYLSQKIKKYFGDGKKWNVNIEYINEVYPLGTIGGLKLLKKKPKIPVIVSNADLISSINLDDMLSFHKKNKSFLTIATKIFESQMRFGVIEIKKNHRISNFTEKPNNIHFINGGLYVFSPDSIDYIFKLNKKKIDITNFCNKNLIKKKKVLSYKFYDSWRDIGIISDFR